MNLNNRGGSSNSNNGNSSNIISPEHFVLPKAWTDQLLAEIKKDEDTIPYDLLLWETREMFKIITIGMF